jgi:AcrR family transcriptional regulator
MSRRARLTHELVVAAAVAVADHGGLAAVSMRNVARELGVEAMSLYHHVASKDALLDALADWAFAQMELPTPGTPWREAMAARAGSARDVLAAHPWALGMLESRSNPGPALLRHHDGVLGLLRGGGFSVELAAHAYSVIDAYVFGFVLTETNLPFEAGEGAEEFVHETAGLMSPEEYPHLTEMAAELVVGGSYDFADEFGYGLELILDSLEARLASS